METPFPPRVWRDAQRFFYRFTAGQVSPLALLYAPQLILPQARWV